MVNTSQTEAIYYSNLFTSLQVKPYSPCCLSQAAVTNSKVVDAKKWKTPHLCSHSLIEPLAKGLQFLT